MTRDLLRAALRADEGTGPMVHGRHMPYRDCCGKQPAVCRCKKPGKLTIGFGRNLEDCGVSIVEADAMLDRDIDNAIKDLIIRCPWAETLDPVRQAVLVEMVFNLGIEAFGRFMQMIGAAKRGDYAAAAVAMLDSDWADQVGARARRLATTMESGVWADR